MNICRKAVAALIVAMATGHVALVRADSKHWTYSAHEGPAEWGYYLFHGSLTTPPCSEAVTWLVLKTPVKIADSEITAFGKIYPMNARPTQALNGGVMQASK